MKTKFYPTALCITLVSLIASVFQSQGQVFQLVPDTVDLYPKIPKTVDLLANDIYPAGDSLLIFPTSYENISMEDHGGGSVTYTDDFWGLGCDSTCEHVGSYAVLDFTLDTIVYGTILFRIWDYSFDSLCLNNINAQFNACGNNFWAGYSYGKFEVPKFSRIYTMSTNTLWIGGLAEDSTLYLAAEKHRPFYVPPNMTAYGDYWAGPVTDSSFYNVNYDSQWNYIWNLKKSDIAYHKAHWMDPGYSPIQDIYTWPANGNVSQGQAAQLAPFFDRNNDGIYNPWDGDYPLIKGDQSLFFIFNDDRDMHYQSHGNKLKMEIHGMAYAFDLPGDSAFNNTIFLNYKIFNRSNRVYFNTYIGTFTDLSIGYSPDDYIGCDVERNSYYGYNGKRVDGTGGPFSYGDNPPAQAITILGGPYLDPDGKDNPRFNETGHQLCNASVNGLNFGDKVVDNERYGMSKFIYFNNSFSGVPLYMQDPVNPIDYYYLIQGIWKDNTRMIYGGNGHNSTGGYGPACSFMFPGISDSLNWGVGCQLPNGPVDWTERTAGNTPFYRHGISSMGPFTFHPGAMEEVDLAFIFARDYNDPDTLNPSVGKLKQMIDIIRNSFITNKLPNGSSFNGIDDNNKNLSLLVHIFPNPASTFVTVDLDRSVNEITTLRLIDYSGTLLQSFIIRPGTSQYKIDVSSLPDGLYLINVLVKDQSVTRKLSVVR